MYMTQALHRAVQQRPNQVAVRFGERTRTFGQVAERIARLARGLQALGLQPGGRVAMLALNSDRYLEYQMAVPWAGGVLNPCNIRWSAAEIAYTLDDSETAILLVDEALRPLVGGIRERSKCLREIIYCGDGERPPGLHAYEALIEENEPVADAMRHGDDLAGVFYTGGTTGFPKGVMLSHANIVSSAFGLAAEGMAPQGSVYLHAAPMFHLADMGCAWPHWLAGNTHSAVPSFSPEAVLQAIERDSVTHMLLVPTMLQILVDSPEIKRPRDLSSLQTVIYGASPISSAVLDRAMVALPNVSFVQAYGMTELSPVATFLHAYHHTAEGRKSGKLRGAGRAAVHVEIRIVDEQGREVPRGTVGEVAVRGPNVMQGYWNKPEQSAAALRDGWMHTGDGAYMDDDGFVFVVDRLKDMIISGGENVYSSEVENALAQHPAVAASAVIGIPSAEWGETVHAVVVVKAGEEATADQLIAHCKTLIAGYKCPRSVSLVGALPLSGAGKILKTVLREPYWGGHKRQVS